METLGRDFASEEIRSQILHTSVRNPSEGGNPIHGQKFKMMFIPVIHLVGMEMETPTQWKCLSKNTRCENCS